MKKTRLLIFTFVALVSIATTAAAAAEVLNFRTHLSGGQEVPPPGVVVNTQAQGQAKFQLSADGSTLHYKLIAANIENAFMAHIHMGPAGANGPIVVWLYPSTATTPGPVGAGRTDGVLVEGDITAANLVGPLTGASLSDLIAQIEAGNTYVNIHTNDGLGDPNTGPGDFPGGEVRGQIH